MKYLASLLIPGLLAASSALAPAQDAVGPFRSSLTVDRAPVDRNAPMLKSYATMLEKVQPAVVTIMTGFDQQRQQRRQRVSEDEAALRFFFGLPPVPDAPLPREAGTWQQLGLGTGVVVTGDGYILTNRHVVLPPESPVPLGLLKIRVQVPGHDEFMVAKLIDYSNDSDVAVLKVEGKDLPKATLADSNQVKVGDVAFALGAPFGIDKTVTMGIISARRNDEVLEGMEKQELLQTDASINPGNSGGPLVDADGRVIGINTAIYTRNGGNMGIGFAIPINNAVAAADALSRPRGFLGVSLAAIDARIARYFGLKGGAMLTRVEENTPAARAGLSEQDIIFSIDGKDVANDVELLREIGQRPPGKTITLNLIREEQKKEVRIILGERPNKFLPQALPGTVKEGNALGPVVAGMKLSPVPAADRDGLKLTNGGLVVTNVEPNTPAANGGLQEGDVIVRINGRQPATAEEAATAFADSQNGSSMLHVRRGNSTKLFVLNQ
ncbi:MAG: protease Do [Verrucomicrobiales bacterium]|nr:protease Do [Verrucomicrobiales bacterium]